MCGVADENGSAFVPGWKRVLQDTEFIVSANDNVFSGVPAYHVPQLPQTNVGTSSAGEPYDDQPSVPVIPETELKDLT